jgi:signal transduction histidine kinase/ActR/RegA family two-component response regulator
MLSLPRRARRSSLGVKLGVLGAVITAAVLCVAFWALSEEIRVSTQQLVTSQLARDQRTLQQLRAREASELLFAASLITQTPSFQYDLNIYSVEKNSTGKGRIDLVNTVEEELRNRLRNVQADLLLVTDDSGRVFASAARGATTVPRGTSLKSLKAVQRALDPTAPADTGDLGVLRTDAGYLEVAVYPLVQAGYTLGSLVLGRQLDSGYLVTARTESDPEVVLTTGNRVAVASDRTLISPAVAALLAAHERDPQAASLRLGAEDYVVMPLSLGETQDREPVHLWILQPLSRRVEAVTGPLRRLFVVYGAIAVIIAAFGATVVARTVLRPFWRFVSYMRSGAAAEQRQGRFDADHEAREVRTLNESFNQLMDSLSGKRRELEQRTAELAAANIVLTDEINERARVERALRESEAQLRQSQKLEAIGTLAGGIAHDFNNLITVISGYTQLALMRAERESRAADDLRPVVEAADRAANLTHQLLAFSRKQVLQPTVLDLGEVVNGIAPMLRRIIGEQVELRLDGETPLARIRADKGQLEQVLLNLAVNARDAMPNGGSVTIATKNLDRAVSLVVSDTGLGMSDEIRDRVFEPFFTTKDPGKGTGLGLSTVYGIVNQSGGTITVDSALGRGTTFTITLPVASVMAAADGRAGAEPVLPRGTETILIVEDAEDVRILARRTLEELGYTVLVARNAEDALEISLAKSIDVLLTDIVMPRTSGPQLVAKYVLERPAPIVIYMSGYADDALAKYEVDPTVVFLRKPFTPASLAQAVRAALDAARGAPSVGSNVGSAAD